MLTLFSTQSYSTLEGLGYTTLIQLWWISVWGISYIVIEYLSHKSKKIELFIYIGLLILVLSIILNKPQLMRHL
jgi:predicted membrane channel-forming protein YqfA (hemolysin III family)